MFETSLCRETNEGKKTDGPPAKIQLERTKKNKKKKQTFSLLLTENIEISPVFRSPFRSLHLPRLLRRSLIFLQTTVDEGNVFTEIADLLSCRASRE